MDIMMKEREKKGRSLIEALSDYVVIDLETTGLDPRWDSIIEVAAIRVQNSIIADSFQSLINPGYKIDEFITVLTGITNKMLSTAPKLSEVLPEFIRYIDSAVVVAHNANFDINFIYDNCLNIMNSNFTNDFIDTMRISRRLFKEYSHHTLNDLVNRFGIMGSVEHRALSDIIKTQQCYEYMKKYAIENGIEFSLLYPTKSYSPAKSIRAATTEFNENTSIFGKLFVFTGALDKLTRKDAMQLVVNMGGLCADNVTKKTDFLVMGNNDYCTTIKDGKTTKQKKVDQLRLAGVDIQTISEQVFFDMLSEDGCELSP